MEAIEEQILSASNTLGDEKLPCYYKYRYTFDIKEYDTLEQQQDMVYRLVRFLKKSYVLGDKITWGIEYYTKGMLTTKPHVHIHFQSRIPADTIRKGVARHFELIGRVQACKAEVLVDEEKFWRYPLKQQLGETKKYGGGQGFTKEQLQMMTEVANACWKQSAEIVVGKLEKKLERTSKERLFVYLDSLGIINEEQIVEKSYEYYVENEDNFCAKIINGYIHIYLLKNKIISYADFRKKYYN